MRIAYFGGDMFYHCMELLIKNGHEIIALFTEPQKSGEYDSSQNVCRQAELLDIPIKRSKPNSDDILDIEQKKCEMILSAGYLYKIPQWQGESIRYGINIHPTLLPEGGGPMPLPLVIIKGLQKTGVTLHELSPQWDAGNIILQESLPLLEQDNIEDLLQKSQKLAVELLQRFMMQPDNYWNNSVHQMHRSGDYWSMSDPDEFVVDYTQDAESIRRRLRAHRSVDAAGNISTVSNITFRTQKHNFEPGDILLQKEGIYIVATAHDVVSFQLVCKQAPIYNFVNKQTSA